jgi:hypothetical protein
MENVLNLPGDAPGDLHIENRSPLPVDVVAADGLTIVLSVPEDIGAAVPYAKLQSNLALLMRKLVDRIEAMAGKANAVGDRILHPFPVGGSPIETDLPHLNPGQARAVSSGIGRNITFIWGPPGTGKSFTIGTLAGRLFDRGRSVLLVSHTNTAVDQALLYISKALSSSVATSAQLDAGKVLRVGDPRDQRLAEQSRLLLGTHVARRSAELAERRRVCEGQVEAAASEADRLSHLINLWEWVQEATADIESMGNDLNGILCLERESQSLADQHLQLSASSAQWSTAVADANRATAWLARIGVLRSDITNAESSVKGRQAAIQSFATKLSESQGTLRETTGLNWIVRAWRGLPKPEEQQKLVSRLENEMDSLRAAMSPIEDRLQALREEHRAYAKQVEAFQQEHRGSPSDVLRRSQERESRLRELLAAAQQTLHRANSRRVALQSTLRARLVAIEGMGYSPGSSDTAEGMLEVVRTAYGRSSDKVRHLDINRVRTELAAVNTSAVRLEDEIADIDESLKKVEQTVISEAAIVATTLTRAYLRDSIQSRRFDTVILDEASMAPIPALWIAASLADANAVLVGDFKQLPPIVQSTHDVAKKWLGRDIFEVAGLTGSDGCPPFPEVLCPLFEQHRMHPAISAVPNHFIYHGQLQDRPESCDESEFRSWYNSEFGVDSPVLLVDTGSLNAWVTSAARSGRSSRLNFLSATVCVDLAAQLLRSQRPPYRDGSRARILIACPYRPHARLVKLILQSEGLSGEVDAGTAHSFQGNEADVVIFDLVNDEPHWRVHLFMPSNDEYTKQLLNVAVTRARRRLIVVGDFPYHLKMAKKAFLGKDVVPYLLQHYRRVDAKAVIRDGLAGRAGAVQSLLQGGPVEPKAARSVMTEKEFFRVLAFDIQNAKSRIVIYSAFLTSHRIGELQTALRAAVDRGVKVFVVTKARDERTENESRRYQVLEGTLAEWGVRVVHKAGMHEKLIFVDNDIIWVGSLNPLSFVESGETMERRRSPEVFAEYERTQRLGDLLKEYEDGQPACPWCHREVVASEGPRMDPFYWRCVQDGCYSRSIDEPALTGDVVMCKRCHSEVEYALRGGTAVWRCKSNGRHFQYIRRTHLRLPKMRAILPPRDLRELEDRFRLSADAVITPGSGAGERDPRGQQPAQRHLFDGDPVDRGTDRKGVAIAEPPVGVGPDAAKASEAGAGNANLTQHVAPQALPLVNQSDTDKIINALKAVKYPLGLQRLWMGTGIERRQLEATVRAMVRDGRVLEVAVRGGMRYSLK